MQWASKILPFEIWKHLKSEHFEDPILNVTVFKVLGYSFSFSYGPDHLKTIQNPGIFVQISNSPLTGWPFS